MADEAQVTEETLNLDETPDSTLESVETNEELTKAQELASNYKIRAERAEQALKAAKAQKTEKTETVTPKNDDLSLSAIRALQDVHDDDVDEVIGYAKFKGVTIAEAKKSSVIQNLLKVHTEERASAEAAATNTNKRRVQKDSDESVLSNFSQGKVDEDPEKVVLAQLKQKRLAAGLKD